MQTLFFLGFVSILISIISCFAFRQDVKPVECIMLFLIGVILISLGWIVGKLQNLEARGKDTE